MKRALSAGIVSLVLLIFASRWAAQQWDQSPQVAFQSGVLLQEDIYVLDVRTRIPINLTRNPYRDLTPLWLPDGERLSFVSNRAGDHLDMYQLELNGATPHILQNTAREEYIAHWSPDGMRLAFLSGIGTITDLYMLESDGSTRRLTWNAIVSSPVWSPDGAHIAYIDSIQNVPDVYIINIAKEKTFRLTQRARAASPNWSPDGNAVIYTADNNGTRGVYAMNIYDQTRRTIIESSDIWIVKWAPAGNRFAYVAGGNLERNLYLAEVIEGHERPHIRQITRRMVTGGMDWTANGDWLVFTGYPSNSGQPNELYAVHWAWDSARRLTYNQVSDLYPTWRPDF